MLHQIGFVMQFGVLVALPLLILWQLEFGIPLVVMPISLLIGIVVFWLGTRLRESR
jgi:hypothetical protein